VARRIEWTLQEPKIVYNINEAETQVQTPKKQVKEKASLLNQPKPILLYEDLANQKVFFDSQLSSEQESNLKRFLIHNQDVFSWLVNELCQVDRSIMEHYLNIDPSSRPRKQKLRKMSEDKSEGAKAEVKRLLTADVIT
jgi:oligoendopeptidase F